MIGEVRYWMQGDALWAVVDEAADRVRLAVVGCEPSRPLLGFVRLKRCVFESAGHNVGA